jgi:hypothetical protein
LGLLIYFGKQIFAAIIYKKRKFLSFNKDYGVSVKILLETFPALPKLKSAFGRSLPKRNWPIFPALGSSKTCKGTLPATNIAPRALRTFLAEDVVK